MGSIKVSHIPVLKVAIVNSITFKVSISSLTYCDQTELFRLPETQLYHIYMILKK